MKEKLLMDPSGTENGKVQYVVLPDWRSCADYGRVSYSIPKPTADVSTSARKNLPLSEYMEGGGVSADCYFASFQTSYSVLCFHGGPVSHFDIESI